jgi:hypothetical protein
MRKASTGRLHLVSLLGFAFAMVGCREGSTFSPSDPATVRERILTELLNTIPNNQGTKAIAGGVTAEVARFQGTLPGEIGAVYRFLMDWTSDANHLTIALYQTAETLDSSGIVSATCRVPGSPVAAPPSLPVCPVVASVTTLEKPKALQHSAGHGAFSIVVTNNGPGNETIRYALEDIGRHTRLSLTMTLNQTAEPSARLLREHRRDLPGAWVSIAAPPSPPIRPAVGGLSTLETPKVPRQGAERWSARSS